MFKIRKIIKSVARMVPRFSTLLDYWLFQVKRISFSNKLTPHSDSRFKSVLSEIELNGFCVIEDFFSKEECLSIRKDYDKLLSDDPNSVQSYSDKRVLELRNVHEKLLIFTLMIFSNPLLMHLAQQNWLTLLHFSIKWRHCPAVRVLVRGGIKTHPLDNSKRSFIYQMLGKMMLHFKLY